MSLGSAGTFLTQAAPAYDSYPGDLRNFQAASSFGRLTTCLSQILALLRGTISHLSYTNTPHND